MQEPSGAPSGAACATQRVVPDGAVVAIWTSPPYSHCMFTARPGLPPEVSRRFADALYAMDFENPRHRPILEAEGLRCWVPPHDGYASLTAACERPRFLDRGVGL